MALDFEVHEDLVFDRAPLINVLCQIRFPPILALWHEAGLTGFQTILREEYPVLLPAETNLNIQVRPDAVGVNTTPPVWKFQDATGKWTLGIALNFISLETLSYTDINEFISRFDRILSALRKTLRPAPSVRIGLRKINVFQPLDHEKPLNFDGILRPEALGLLAMKGFPAAIMESSSHVAFQDGENVLVINSGIGKTSKEEIVYLLDMDYFTERKYEIMDGEELTSLLRHFSDGMTNYFHWAVDENYKLTLDPRPRLLAGDAR